MTDKVTIQPKSKPEKTTISISGETSERLEIYCRGQTAYYGKSSFLSPWNTLNAQVST